MEENYYKSKESVEEYIRLAKDVNGGILINHLKNHLESGSQVLEIGSGPGTDWEILSEIFEVTGSDNSAKFIEHLQATFPSGDFLELDAETLKTDNKFQGIYSNKVLHHLTDDQLQASIERQFQMLNAGGVVCHSFWEGKGSEIFKGLFVNYHEENKIRKFFENHFDSLLVLHYAEFEEEDSILYLGKKKS